jgi:DNA-binding transcriptional ArsR family regulator
MATKAKQARLFGALGHPFRLDLLAALRSEEVCVCHLSALFGKPQPYVSKQLAELRDAGLIASRRDGLRVYYRLADPTVNTVVDASQLALLALGVIGPVEMAPDNPLIYPVAGCECPRCSVERGEEGGAHDCVCQEGATNGHQSAGRKLR